MLALTNRRRLAFTPTRLSRALPLPLAWIAKASRLSHSTLKTALALWYVQSLQAAILLSNRHRRDEIYITRQASELFNISRDCEREGLRQLEAAELIQILKCEKCAGVLGG